MSRVEAVLDTCSLFGRALRDVLLTSAELGLFVPYWSHGILAELRVNLVEHNRMTDAQAEALVEAMQQAFPDAMVAVDPGHLEALPVNAKDRHVLSVAVTAPARLIVTDNIRHFAAKDLAGYAVEAVTPDAFLLHLLKRSESGTLGAVHRISERLKRPPMTAEKIAIVLSASAPGFSQALLAALGAEKRGQGMR
ncbi:MAG TPA: PIN domain-containing protein [Armatimonadota bacterium]|jgi:predicted nucleic acid-binding protein